MARRLISSGTEWEALAGFSRAVVDGEWVFVSGCTGFDNETSAIAEDAVEQTHKTFSNIEAALAQAGARLEDVVRFTVIVPDRDDFIRIAPVLGEYFGAIRPASTAMICGLADPRMKVEIEVTAKRPPS